MRQGRWKLDEKFRGSGIVKSRIPGPYVSPSGYKSPNKVIKSTAGIKKSRGMLSSGQNIGVSAFATAALGITAINTATKVTRAFRRGLLPNTAHAAGGGQFGFRTARDAGPAGIEGLRFQFRRK